MTSATTAGLRSKSVSCAPIAALVYAAIAPLNASGIVPEARQQTGDRGAAENTQIVVNGGIVNVNYDLVGPDAQSYEVVLEVSQNGGRTYELKPRTLSGDVGPGVRPGVGRRIVWDAAKDTDALQLGEYRFRVTVKPERASSALSPSQTTPPAGQQAAPPAGPSIANSGRSPYFWPSIGMIGGGAVLAIMSGFGPLKHCPFAFQDCANKPGLGIGAGVAGGGWFLLKRSSRGLSRSPSVDFSPKGMLIVETIRF